MVAGSTVRLNETWNSKRSEFHASFDDNRDISCKVGYTAKICAAEGSDDLDDAFLRITYVVTYHSVYVGD